MMTYEEMRKRLEEDEDLFDAAYKEFLEDPTIENKHKCELLAGNISDDKWDLQRSYPTRPIDSPTYKMRTGGARC